MCPAGLVIVVQDTVVEFEMMSAVEVVVSFIDQSGAVECCAMGKCPGYAAGVGVGLGSCAPIVFGW